MMRDKGLRRRAVFERLGREGFMITTRRCMSLTKLLSHRLEALGFKIISQPTLNIVAFKGSNSKLLSEKLRRRGWFVSNTSVNCIRIVAMPNLRKRHIMAFLRI